MVPFFVDANRCGIDMPTDIVCRTCRRVLMLIGSDAFIN